MSFIRIKTIKKKDGRTYQYAYRQTSIRAGKKVRSLMEYIGPVGGSARHSSEARQDRALATAERMAKEMDAYQRATFGETGGELAAREMQERQFDQAQFLEATQSAPTDRELFVGAEEATTTHAVGH